MKAPSIKAPKMEPGTPAFPRMVSSKTTHTLTPMKPTPSVGFDSQVGGVPSMGVKPPKLPKVSI